MAKDLIIGGASNYNWDQLKYWVNSIKQTGFKGDIVLVATNMSGETVNKLVENLILYHSTIVWHKNISKYNQNYQNQALCFLLD